MKLLVVGAGAQAKYSVEIAKRLTDWSVDAVVDAGEPEVIGTDMGGVNVIDQATGFKKYPPASDLRVITAFSDPAKKEEWAKRLREQGYQFATLLHPSVVMATTAEVGEGTIVNPQAVIQPFARVGNHVMLHAGAIVEHDCQIDDYANLAPGATLAGWVRVGKRTRLFMGCKILPGISVGDDVTVGAGAVVRHDVPALTTVVGVPARLK